MLFSNCWFYEERICMHRIQERLWILYDQFFWIKKTSIEPFWQELWLSVHVLHNLIFLKTSSMTNVNIFDIFRVQVQTSYVVVGEINVKFDFMIFICSYTIINFFTLYNKEPQTNNSLLRQNLNIYRSLDYHQITLN